MAVTKKTTKKQTAKKPEPVVKTQVKAESAQVKAETAVPPVCLHMSRERLQEALVWTEILGEPKCRKRHPRRRSRISSMQ